jgi:hypothetical protein
VVTGGRRRTDALRRPPDPDEPPAPEVVAFYAGCARRRKAAAARMRPLENGVVDPDYDYPRRLRLDPGRLAAANEMLRALSWAADREAAAS